jgi:hypothetical protein
MHNTFSSVAVSIVVPENQNKAATILKTSRKFSEVFEVFAVSVGIIYVSAAARESKRRHGEEAFTQRE